MSMFMGERKVSLYSSSLLPCKVKTPLHYSLLLKPQTVFFGRIKITRIPSDVYPKRDAYFNKCLILA